MTHFHVAWFLLIRFDEMRELFPERTREDEEKVYRFVQKYFESIHFIMKTLRSPD